MRALHTPPLRAQPRGLPTRELLAPLLEGAHEERKREEVEERIFGRHARGEEPLVVGPGCGLAVRWVERDRGTLGARDDDGRHLELGSGGGGRGEAVLGVDVGCGGGEWEGAEGCARDGAGDGAGTLVVACSTRLLDERGEHVLFVFVDVELRWDGGG